MDKQRLNLLVGKKILLAEDNELNQEIAVTMLEMLHIEVECVGNGDLAVQRFLERGSFYYDMILMKDPYSWEANFYTVYYKSMSCKIAEIKSAIANVENCIEDTLNLIKTYVTDDEKRVNAVAEVVMRTGILADMMQKSYVRHYNGISSSIRSNYAVEKLSVTIATTTAKAKPISCIIYLFADDEYLILNYGY